MGIAVRALDHVNVTVPRAAEDAARRFYADVVGLREIPKPAETRGRGGMWFAIGAAQLHVSIEEATAGESRRHICLTVADLGAARSVFEAAGIAILPDERPVPGWQRFYVCDPGGNRLEIAQPDAA